MADLFDVGLTFGDEQALKTASMAHRARVIARRLYAALPRGVRLANFFVRLAAESPNVERFGRMVYAEFIRKGITGMPPIHGKPVEEVVDRSKPIEKQLPLGYGSAFAQKAYRTLLALGIPPSSVEDVMQDYLIELVTKSKVGEGDFALHHAEAYVLRGLRQFALTRRRSMNRRLRREAPTLVTEDDGVMVDREVKDESGLFDALDKVVSQNYLNRMIDHLEAKLGDRVGDGVITQYMERAFEGDEDTRILPDLPLKQFKSRGGWHHFKHNILYPAMLEFFSKHPPSNDFEKRLQRYTSH